MNELYDMQIISPKKPLLKERMKERKRKEEKERKRKEKWKIIQSEKLGHIPHSGKFHTP